MDYYSNLLFLLFVFGLFLLLVTSSMCAHIILYVQKNTQFYFLAKKFYHFLILFYSGINLLGKPLKNKTRQQ